MNNLIMSSLFYTLISIPLAIYFSYYLSIKVNLIDKPNIRKNHKGEIPLVGGISIISSLLLFIFIFEQPYYINIIILSSLLILFIGVYDDLNQSSITLRILIQLIASIIIILFGLHVVSLGEYYYFGDIKTSYLGIILTIIFVLGLTNSVNLIDGIDGLAAGIVLIGLLSLFLFSYLKNPILDIDLFIFLICSLVIFIIFNLGFIKNKKIFLGDSGSTTLGFILGWLLVYYAHSSNNNLDPSLSIWCVTVPVFDLLSLLIIRTNNKKNPLHPDHNHIHHTLLRLGFMPRTVLIIIILLSIIFSIIGFVSFYYFGATVTLINYFICFIIYLNIRLYHLKKERML